VTQAVANPSIELHAELQAEQDRTREELSELNRLVDQSLREVEKLAQRNTAITAHVRQLQANLESMPRADIKAAYEAAQEAQQRLFTMRGQLERLQAQQANLVRLAGFLERSIHALESAGTPASLGDNLPVLVRVVEAQEAERQRLSRQIHDGPAQALSNFILQTEIAMRLFDIDTQQAREELKSLKGTATTTFQKLRDFIFDLRPMMLDDLGLVPTVKRYVDSYKEKSGMQCSMTVTGTDQRLDSAREVVIFRGLQELLGNIRQHAQATQVRILMEIDADRVRVTVEDNGTGFDAHAAVERKAKATGLATLKDRMDLLGGYLQVDSQLGNGARIVMEVPVDST
jgi:two-component system, NarL family, sensor histidine kinase DegS